MGKARFALPQSTYFMGLVGLFVSVMLISNVVVTKGVVFFPGLEFSLGPIQVNGIVTDGAFFLFPLAYVLGDVISEVYGFRTMRKVIALGFVCLLLMTGSSGSRCSCRPPTSGTTRLPWSR